jgi:hypothetical protein
VLAVGCAGVPRVVSDLPELPAEYAKDLVLARTAPVLITRPAGPAPQVLPKPPGPGIALAPARACTSIHEGYATYPITVCYPPTVLYETLSLQPAGAAPPAPPRGLARYFKLTSHPEARFGLPWFCSVRSGPWYARVEGAQICNADPNIRVFTAQLLGAPEPVVVVWTGPIGTPPPPPLVLVAVTPSGESCVCCSGFMCPDGRCVPDFKHCEVKPPA